MANVRKSYPSDVSDEEWGFCVPYLTLMNEHAPQRKHSLRELFNGLRWFVRAGCPWRMMPNDLPTWTAVQQQTQRWLRAGCFEAIAEDLRLLLRVVANRTDAPSAVILDSRTLQSTPESGARAGFDGHKKRKGSKLHAVVDTLGHLLAVKVTAANKQDRAQVADLAAAVQLVTGQNVQVAFVDQGYTGRAAGHRRRPTRVAVGSDQTSRSQTGVCVTAAPVGGRTFVCVGRTLPATGARLRATRLNTRRLSLAGLCLSHAQFTLCQKCMTGSRGY